MCTRSRHVTSAAILLVVLGMPTLLPASFAAEQGACAGFDTRHTITALGGAHALSPGGGQTLAEMQAYFAAHEAEVRAVLTSRGLGEEVATALLATVSRGSGVAERPMTEGERLQWMAYRKDGTVQTIDNVCLRLVTAAPAFEITVPVVTAAPPAPADCSLDVAVDCQPGGTSSFRVRTAPGAVVTQEGPTGTRTVIEGGATAWTGVVDHPYSGAYAFAVTNSAATTETVTSYTFLVPRECLNLAFVGLTESQRPGAPVTCTDRRTLVPPVCPVPPAPACTVDLDLTTARRGDVASYQVTGTWTTLELALLHDGVALAEPRLSGERGTLTLAERGSYTVVATVDNVVGDEASCRASVEVTGTDWIVRPFAAFLATGDPKMTGSVTPGDCPCAAATAYGCDDGYGLGIGVERLLSERVGVEARVLYGRLDNRFSIAANGVGIDDHATLDAWDLSIGLNLHLLPDGPVDWYAGPFVGYLWLEDRTLLVVDRSLEYDAESDLSFGAQTGLDWPFGDSDWSLHMGARYSWASPDLTQRYTDPNGTVFEQPTSFALDPLTLELGVAYHF